VIDTVRAHMVHLRSDAARKGLVIPVIAGVLLSGCAARKGPSFANRFVKPGEPTTSFDAPGAAAPQQTLDDYGRRLRSLQSMPRTKASLLPTIESSDRRLSAALQMLAFHETAENHRAVARAYRDAGVTDYAYRHFVRALKLEPCDSASHEGIAQLWREWGRPELALGDVYRAIHCQPQSASAYNTLGTVLLTLGQRANARKAFDFALRLDAGAAYALNNLCYLSVVEGNGVGAQQACERALSLEPTLRSAKINLALAFAMQGEVSIAEQRLMGGVTVATGQYNVGILRMSLGQYADAADAFELALKAQPNLSEAARRAVQARAFAAAHKEP
jgi:Flp pilus assembly protein TadD